MRIASIAGVLLTSAALNVAAIAADDPVSACRSIADAAERLKCFDQAPAKPEEIKTGGWYKQESISDLDRSKTVSIVLNSTRSSIARQGSKPQFARLAVICNEKRMSLYVDFREDIAYGLRTFTAQYRIGTSAPVSVQWSVSQDHKAFGPFKSPATIPMLKAMLSAKDFYVRGQDEYAGTSDALFDIEGIGEAIKPVREACKW